MEGRDARGTVALLVNTDVAVCDRDQLAELASHVHRVRGWLAAYDLAIAARASDLSREGTCESPATLLGCQGRRSARDAETAARRATACDMLPAFRDALESGAVSAEHVDAVAGLVRGLDDARRSELSDLS